MPKITESEIMDKTEAMEELQDLLKRLNAVCPLLFAFDQEDHESFLKIMKDLDAYAKRTGIKIN